jgi:uncharacterized protein YbjT (DUF2867 family)
MKALIIGATGATGQDLVSVLLQDPHYTEVVAFVRRSSGRSHPKLSEIITDFDHLEKVADSIRGDVWFSCLGTTRSAAGSQEKQWHIDYEIPARFAEIARQNGVAKAVVLSAYGADSTSKVFYSRMKGTLDDHIAALAFEQCILFRPGFLLRQDTDRAAERLTAGVLKFLNGLGLFLKFRPLPTSLLAEKLAKAPTALPPGKHIIALDEIFGF